jgi:hypothetical protein
MCSGPVQQPLNVMPHGQSPYVAGHGEDPLGEQNRWGLKSPTPSPTKKGVPPIPFPSATWPKQPSRGS